MRYHEFRIVENRFQLFELSDAIKKQQRERFRKEKPDLTDAQIDYYLDRWDQYAGSFEPQYRDITRLTFDQVEQLIDDAIARSEIKGKSKTRQVFDKNDDLIYNRNNMQIIKGDLREKCIQYGQGYTWCISRTDASNMFFTYRMRMDEPMFYFVFDMDKPRDDIWHAVVIYVNRQGVYKVATARNPGDVEMSWDRIVQKQPKLRGLEQLFVHQPLTPQERADYEKYGKPVDLEKYKSYRLSEKLKYIKFGHELTSEQQDATPDELIPTYAKSMPTRSTKTTWNRLKRGDQRYIIKSLEELEDTDNNWREIERFIRNTGIEPVKHIVAEKPRWAYLYAADVIGDRWREGEPAIAKDPVLAYLYARYVIGGRWPEAEPTIVKDPQRAYLYAHYIIGDRWPEAEPVITKDPELAYEYAAGVIGDRFPEAEPVIASDPWYKKEYERRYNVDLDKELRDK